MREAAGRNARGACRLCVLSILAAAMSLVSFYSYVDWVWDLGRIDPKVMEAGALNWRLIFHLRIVSLVTAPLSLLLALGHRFKGDSPLLRPAALTLSTLACLATTIII